jgi:hypothetical protein
MSKIQMTFAEMKLCKEHSDHIKLYLDVEDAHILSKEADLAWSLF